MYLILFTDIFKSKGGIPVFNHNFLKAMVQCLPDAPLYVICLNDKGIPDKTAFEDQVRFIYCGSEIRLWSKIKFVMTTLMFVVFKRPVSVVCGHINFTPLCMFIKKLFGINYIVLTHGIEVWNIQNRLKRCALRNANVIVTISNHTLSKIKSQFKGIDDKSFILPDTIDGNSFYPGKKPEYLLKRYNFDSCRVLMTVARFASFEQYKGYDKVIKALPKVIKEIPNVKYLLVGTGDDIPRIKKLAEKLGVENHIVFSGSVRNENLIDYYNLCDVFVMPSKGEGFGIVFLEALACGKPVIAGNKDGSVDALLGGELGVLIDPVNEEEIANTIIKVLKKEVPDRLLDSKYLRGRVLEVYGLDKFTKKVKALIEGAA